MAIVFGFMKTDLCEREENLLPQESKMNFSPEMIARLSVDEQLVLRLLFERAQEVRQSIMAPEWQWTMPGPAPTVQKASPSPRLRGDTGVEAARLLGATASVVARGSQASSPALHPLTL